VKNYSSGMYVRLGFAIAINVDPEILLVDEVLAVGDTAFQAKCTEKFDTLNREGRTVVLVSHSIPTVRAMASHAAWLQKGKVREIGAAQHVLERYEESTRGVAVKMVDGREHTGSGEVRVTRVEVETPSGGSRLTVGEPARLRIHYQADERVPTPVIGFAIEAIDGAYLAATNTRDAEAPVAELRGTGSVVCELPQVWFHPGDYIVTTAITDATTTHSYDHVRDIARFTVDSGETRWSGGYLALPARWSAASTA
jgi:ABC-2 type transport system ATP-binding protein